MRYRGLQLTKAQFCAQASTEERNAVPAVILHAGDTGTSRSYRVIA